MENQSKHTYLFVEFDTEKPTIIADVDCFKTALVQLMGKSDFYNLAQRLEKYADTDVVGMIEEYNKYIFGTIEQAYEISDVMYVGGDK